MLLYYIASKDKLTLFDEICSSKGIIIRNHSGQVNLKKLIIENMTNFSHISYFVVDIDAVKNTDEEIIEAFIAFQSMYNARIIIIIFSEARQEKLLMRLIESGIYNIIASKDNLKSEFEECMSELGRQYKSAAIECGNVDLKDLTVKVGICGTQSRIGTTTQGILITKALHTNGLKSCYVEANRNNHIKTLAGYYEVEHIEKLKCIKYAGVDMFYDNSLISTLLKMNYKFYIIDYGILTENIADEFLKCDIKILCAGTRPWELENIVETFKLIPKYGEVNFIFNFTPAAEQADIKQLISEYSKKVYFSETVNSMFLHGVNRNIYTEMFKDYFNVSKPKTEMYSLKEKIKGIGLKLLEK